MKRPREDSSGESDDEATKQSRGPSVSLEGGDVTSQGEEGNLPAVEMDVERGEGGHAEIGGQEDHGEGGEDQEQGEGEHVEIEGQEEFEEGEEGEDQEQEEGEPQGEEVIVMNLVREIPRQGESQGEGENAETEGQDDPEVVEREREVYQDYPEDIERVENQVQRAGGDGDIEEQRVLLEAERAQREAEEDLRFKDDLDSLRSRQSKVRSLKFLSLRCISNNTDYLQTVPEQLNELPVSLFRLVADHMAATGKTRSLENLSLIISEKAQELTVYLGQETLCTPDKVTKVLQLIEEKCKTTLECLHLEVNLPRNEDVVGTFFGEQINSLLGSLKNLTELSLESMFCISDDTLEVLGLNCDKLESLSLDHSTAITDAGVNNLCARAAPYGQCKNLEELYVNGTSVSVDGLVTALSNLPKLATLSHILLLSAIEKFVDINGNTKMLQLTDLTCEPDSKLAPADDMEKVCKVVPHINCIMMDELTNLDGFFNHVDVEFLQVKSLYTTLPELNFFVNKFSSTLTSCHLSYCNTVIDFSVFGLCPNLEELFLSCFILPTSEFQLSPDSFMKLEYLGLAQYMFELFNGRINAIPVDELVIMQMLSSPRLTNVCLGFVTVPEACMYSLILEAKKHQQVFSRLESFETRENVYSPEIWMQFICVCPKWKKIKCHASLESRLRLKRFIERNNLTNIRFLRNAEPQD